jgi:hypothetical protein
VYGVTALTAGSLDGSVAHEDRLMSGIDPYAYLQQVSLRMHELNSRNEIEQVLDELEYLFEVIAPDMQDNAENLITVLREKLANAS